jgi:phosphoribosyl 1,2-cyclic phosphodiesterase
MLKQRVGGNHGHLSNLQSLELLQRIDTRGLKCLVAAHISEKNNTPDIVARMLAEVEDIPEPILADQQAGFDWINL